jgi:hypothetical protein
MWIRWLIENNPITGGGYRNAYDTGRDIPESDPDPGTPPSNGAAATNLYLGKMEIIGTPSSPLQIYLQNTAPNENSKSGTPIIVYQGDDGSWKANAFCKVKDSRLPTDWIGDEDYSWSSDILTTFKVYITRDRTGDPGDYAYWFYSYGRTESGYYYDDGTGSGYRYHKKPPEETHILTMTASHTTKGEKYRVWMEAGFDEIIFRNGEIRTHNTVSSDLHAATVKVYDPLELP